MHIDEKDRRINILQLMAVSVGGVAGSLVSALIHTMDYSSSKDTKSLINWQQVKGPELCFGIYMGLQLLLFITGACLAPAEDLTDQSIYPEVSENDQSIYYHNTRNLENVRMTMDFEFRPSDI